MAISHTNTPWKSGGPGLNHSSWPAWERRVSQMPLATALHVFPLALEEDSSFFLRDTLASKCKRSGCRYWWTRKSSVLFAERDVPSACRAKVSHRVNSQWAQCFASKKLGQRAVCFLVSV